MRGLLRQMAMVAVVGAAGCGMAWGQAGAAASVAAPATPAGAVLAAWLQAFDSMDRATVERYIATYDPKASVDGVLGFARSVRGFTLVKADASEPLVVHFEVRDGNGETGAGMLRVSAGEPHVVEGLTVRRVPKGAKVEWTAVDAAERKRVVDRIVELLDERYTDEGVAKKMDAAIEAKLKAGAYDGLTDGSAFANRLTDDLKAVSHDGHLSVGYSPVVDDGKPTPGDDDAADARRRMLGENCGWQKVEILPMNVGYVKFDYFGRAGVCGAVAAEAMGFLAHTSAVIFDLRENHGGDPEMVSTVLSWLFDHAVHVNDLVTRADHETHQYWTLPWVPGERLVTQPVYVLVSHRTFSGGEEFTYDVQTQKRGVIVGETTGGGAHPVSGQRIDDHFEIGVPFAHPVNPVTGKDWEGTGVVPDVSVPAKDALEKAEQLAAEKLRGK